MRFGTIGVAGLLVVWIAAVTGVKESVAAAVLFGLFSLPGWKIGRASSCRGNPSTAAMAMVSGCSLSLLSVILLGLASGSFNWHLVVAAVLLAVAVVWPCRDVANVACRPGAQWSPSESAWLVAALLVVLSLISPAMLAVAARVEAGVLFRPFFNADFFKHLGISQAFAIGRLPPTDPFGVVSTVHYYWFQHLLPGTLLSLPAIDLEPVATLIAVGMVQTVLLTALLFEWCRRLSGSASSSFLIITLAIASPSLDGLAAFILSDGWVNPSAWLSGMQRWNMEAFDLTTAVWSAPYHVAASTLYRLNLYIPQHQLCALLFVGWALIIATAPPRRDYQIGRLAIVAIMPGTSFLLGVPAVVAMACASALIAIKHRRPSMVWPEALGAALAVALVFTSGIIAPKASALELAVADQALTEPALLHRLAWLPIQLLTSLGIVGVLGLVGVVAHLRDRRGGSSLFLVPGVAVLVAVFGYLMAEIAIPNGRLRIDVELKLSFLLAVGLLPFATSAATRFRSAATRPAIFGAMALLLAGLISTVHDVVWHSCRATSCTNSWNATVIPEADWRALAWIRKHTPRRAIFQQSPQDDFIVGGVDVWIPPIAGRAMYASRRGSRSTAESLQAVRRIYDPAEPESVARQARRLGIEYLYLSRALERGTYSELQSRFGEDVELLPVYSDPDVSVWRVGEVKSMPPNRK